MAQPHPARTVVDAAVLPADLTTIDLLARMQLGARRLGRQLSFRDGSDDLARLIAFAGLDEVLRVEPRGETEQGEQPLGAEEERQFLDPPV
jgi:hypothetical protein